MLALQNVTVMLLEKSNSNKKYQGRRQEMWGKWNGIKATSKCTKSCYFFKAKLLLLLDFSKIKEKALGLDHLFFFEEHNFY